jgi:hypothetical protein
MQQQLTHHSHTTDVPVVCIAAAERDRYRSSTRTANTTAQSKPPTPHTQTQVLPNVVAVGAHRAAKRMPKRRIHMQIARRKITDAQLKTTPARALHAKGCRRAPIATKPTTLTSLRTAPHPNRNLTANPKARRTDHQKGTKLRHCSKGPAVPLCGMYNRQPALKWDTIRRPSKAPARPSL